jgi:hypothetical protein
MGLTTTFFVVSGTVLAAGYDLSIESSANVLTGIQNFGVPRILCKVTVSIFTYLMLVPAIPVNMIISHLNFTQNEIFPPMWAAFASFVVPWIVCIPLQTGHLIFDFQKWTSIIFVSTANFIIPVLIYLQCLNFRRGYNADKILSEKQLKLLFLIHEKSETMNNFIKRKRDSITSASDVTPRVSVDAPLDRLNPPKLMIQNGNVDLEDWLPSRVPDPDMEDYMNEPDSFLLPIPQTTLTSLISPHRRKSTSNTNDTEMWPALSRATTATMRPSVTENAPPVTPRRFLTLPRVDLEKNSPLAMEAVQAESTLGGEFISLEDLPPLNRLMTLPTNHEFVTPAFRLSLIHI